LSIERQLEAINGRLQEEKALLMSQKAIEAKNEARIEKRRQSNPS